MKILTLFALASGLNPIIRTTKIDIFDPSVGKNIQPSFRREYDLNHAKLTMVTLPEHCYLFLYDLNLLVLCLLANLH